MSKCRLNARNTRSGYRVPDRGITALNAYAEQGQCTWSVVRYCSTSEIMAPSWKKTC